MNRVSLTTVKVLLLGLLLSSANSSLSQNVHYRWINERGEPVYSDRPPPKGVDYELISSASASKRAVSAEEGAVPAQIKTQAGNNAEQAETTRIKKNVALCERATANLDALNSSAEVRARNDQGEVYTLTPEELEVQRQTATAQVSVYCD